MNEAQPKGRIMIEMKCILITWMLIVHAIVFSYGQNNCQMSKIYGSWKSIGSVGGYENVIDNVDSLKKIIHIHSNPEIYEFRMNATYTYSNRAVNRKRPLFKEDVYTFDEKTCQIILGTKKQAYKKSNLKVLYVDGDYMIITNDNNPHGDNTTLYSKL
jgi:hypothetical protein